MDHNQSKKVVTRIAPSPTGRMHIGTIRTALFNYLFAKHHDGSFIMRIEDTDKERNKKEWIDVILKDFEVCNLEPEHIFVQSKHLDRHRELLQKLVESDRAYISTEPSKNDPAVNVDVVRLRNPGTVITFNDLVRGDVTFDTTELGDFVIARSIDDPLYHFAVVVDDYDEEVTHILRAEEHISNTPRQILIQKALNFPKPVYAHLPLILAPDRSKLSKRHGAVSLQEYLEDGFLPEAIINYLALLGWNPGTEQEFFTLEQLVSEFSIEKVQKSGAVFDMQKLLWLQRRHLQERPIDFQDEYLTEALHKASIKEERVVDRFLRMRPTLLERYVTTEELVTAISSGEFSYLTETHDIDIDLLQWKNDPNVKAALPRLKKVITLLEDCDFSSSEEIKDAIFPYAETVGKGEVLWPLRIALTNQKQSADPFSVAFALQKEETLARIRLACAKIEE